MTASDPLIHLEGVTKVFVTDEVETHALSGIHIDIQRGEYVSISGPSGCGKSTLLAILGSARFAEFRNLHPERQAGAESEAVGARAHPEPRDRLHLPGIQSDRRPECLRKRRAAA